MAAGGRNTICTIFKDLALPHKTKYVAAAVRFQGQWVFIRMKCYNKVVTEVANKI